VGDFDVDLGNLFRRESGRMTSALTRLFGVRNLPLVEDVVADALTKAVEIWKISGVPENPAAWLTAAAKNRAIDVLRRERTARTFEPELAAALSTEWSLVPAVDEAFGDEVIEDEQLRMMFACCHGRLAEEVRIALVLNLMCGFAAREIAHAFLVSESAMEKRLSRGKAALAEAGALPEVTHERVAEHLPSVHRALYLLFNEGYHGAHPSGAVRAELCREAIHLTVLLANVEETALPATHALLALMCFCAARLPGRRDEAGELVALDAQDRSKWDRELVKRGEKAMERSAAGAELTTYHVEAAIAYEHATAPSRAETAWHRIVAMYDMLGQLAPSPVVSLNRAIALGEAEGPERALAAIAELEKDDRLASYPFLAAAKGEQLAKLGRGAEARAAFERAAGLARSDTERRYLEGRAARCG
jgi:RNA polymerase sigma-70 factor (ECF subfamily)